MRANLYLSSLSFSLDGESTIESICSQITELFITYMHVNEHATRFPENGDVVFKCQNIYYMDLFKEIGCEFTDLYSKSFSKLPADVKMALLKLIDRPKFTSEDEGEIVQKIMKTDKQNLNGFLCINKKVFDEQITLYLVDSTNEWYLFHRRHLANYENSEELFYLEIKCYFENIYFHSNVEKSLKGLEDGGLKNFTKAIVFNLTQLNDNFKSYPITSSLRETLKRFSSDCGVKATLEGNVSRKPDFTFTFYDTEGNPDEICCEPHLKLARSDELGDTGYRYNRIHFHQGKSNVEDGKILVGHIGRHL